MSTMELQNNKSTYIHPYKVILYISFASILMFFAITTSALLVKKGDIVSWEAFKLPNIFYISTLILIGSSALMHFAKNSYANAKFTTSRFLLLLSILAFGVFIISQYFGLQQLTSIGKPLSGNSSGSFVWVLVMAHAVHIIGGLLFSSIIAIKAFINRNDKNFELNNKVNPKRLLAFELLNTYWHFMDFVWIYLFIFFYFNY